MTTETGMIHNVKATLADLLVPIAVLRHYPGNARRHADEVLRESLRINGQYRPIVVSVGSTATVASKGTVLAGNGTLAAARELGWTHVAATWVDEDDEAAARIVAVDNRANDLAYQLGYDDALLADLLQGMSSLEGSGYDQAFLDELLASTRPREALTDPDAIPEPPAEPVSTRGDVWLLGPHRLMCGDSTSAEDVAKLMAGDRARLMATDPPYLVDYDGGNHPATKANKGNTKKQWDQYVDHDHASEFFRAFIEVALAEALIPSPAVYQWHADRRVELVLAAWKANGLLPHQFIVWVKSRAVLTFSQFMQQHEVCLYGWVKGAKLENERRPPANVTTVWEISQHGASNDLHPTEKPVEIFGRPIRWHTRAGELCFEPFSGSGAQIIAAHGEGRRCYAMELAPEFVDVGCRRWQEHTGIVPVLERTGREHDFTTGGE